MNKLWDLFSGSDKFMSIVVSWFIPILLYAILLVVVVAPELRGSALIAHFTQATHALGLNRALAVLVLVAVASTVGHLLRDDLYRVLEGYSWPRWIRERRRDRCHIPEAQYLLALREFLRASQHNVSVDLRTRDLAAANLNRRRRGQDSVWCERLHRYRPLFAPMDRGPSQSEEFLPRYPEQLSSVAATKFGNAMAAVESFGYETYGLDSQSLWFELIDVIGNKVVHELDETRAKIDALVVLVISSFMTALIALGSFLWVVMQGRNGIGAAILALIAWMSGVFFYHLLLRSVEDYGFAIRAIVNQGRVELAKNNGLSIPQTIAEERRMWEAFIGFIHYSGNKHYERKLDPFRLTPTSQDPGNKT